MTPVRRLVAWRGPDPERVDVAHVVLDDDRLSARGTSCAADHATAYRLDTGPGWVTRALDVRTLSDAGERRLEMHRGVAGRWAARRWVDGHPTPFVLPDLQGALDCDLALSPLTNTMPVLRTGLLAHADRTARVTVAWVDVPDLTVHAEEQDYGPAVLTDDGGAVVRFAQGDFTAAIVLDRDGLVVSYPGIAERLAP
jgi:uncharacterized protein